MLKRVYALTSDSSLVSGESCSGYWTGLVCMTDKHIFDCQIRNSACPWKSGLIGLLVVTLAVSNSITAKCLASSHKAHSGGQRYGDVIIIRHADGTIESRDASGPTVTYDDGTPVHHSSRTSHGGKSSAKTSLKRKASAPSANGKQVVHSGSTKHQHTAYSRASSGNDDVEIIRNPDGSVEARDAQ